MGPIWVLLAWPHEPCYQENVGMKRFTHVPANGPWHFTALLLWRQDTQLCLDVMTSWHGIAFCTRRVCNAERWCLFVVRLKRLLNKQSIWLKLDMLWHSCEASRHTCYKALKALYRDLRPFIQQGLAKLIKILRRIVHRADCSAQFIPKMFYGVTVGRSWRLLHLCDIALLSEIEDYPSTKRSGVVILIAVVVPEIVPGKWH